MNRPSLLLPLALGLSVIAGAPAFAQDGLTTPQQQSSYAVGLTIGSSMRRDGVTLDEPAFLRGVRDALANAKPALTEEQLNAALRQLQVDLQTRQAEKMAALAKVNAEAGAAFLKANGARPGVVT